MTTISHSQRHALRPHAVTFAPAVMLTLALTVVLTGARLWPIGQQTVLVRLGTTDPVAAVAAAAEAEAEAVLMDIPAPGYAVLQGDSTAIRSHVGLAILYKGFVPCTPTPRL